MVDSKLLEYVKICLSRQIPLEKIKQDLLKEGWLDADIDKAINLANNPQDYLPVPKEPEIKNKSPKIFFILLGVSIVILIILGVLLFMILSPTKISDNALSQGTSTILKESKEVKFNLNEEEHSLILNSMSADSASITIQPELINIILNMGEIQKFDLDSDGTYDLLIELNNITSGKADIYIKKISEVICTENWNCTEWDECADAIQTRVCNDLNNCEVEENKPVQTQECQVVFSRVTNCRADIDCFINKSQNCTLANITYNFTVDLTPLVGWVQNHNYYYEIKGFENDNCMLYNKILNVNGSYTEAQRQSLLEGGKNETEINQSEQESNDALSTAIGKESICRYPTDELVEMLEGMKVGDFSGSSEDVHTYNCTGSLYESVLVNITYICVGNLTNCSVS